jgi:hypothetical protein
METVQMEAETFRLQSQVELQIGAESMLAATSTGQTAVCHHLARNANRGSASRALCA